MPVRWPVTNADQVRGYVALTHAHCPRCHYALRGLRDPVCPECGLALTVEELTKPRGLAAVRIAVFGEDTGAQDRVGSRPLRLLAALNVVAAVAIMVSAFLNHGDLPMLSWLAPAVLGAFAFSIQYVAVFTKYAAARGEGVEVWGEGIASIVLLTQAAGLICMWV